MTIIPLTDPATTDEQTTLLQSMLDGAINGVLLLQPVRDAEQTITDFLILAANRAVKDMTGIEPTTAVGKTMDMVYPGYKAGGFFGVYCDVMADGKARRTEHYYEDPTLKGWFEVSVVRQYTGLVLTFSNITAAKEATQVVQEATNYLQHVIDFSQTGIFVITPVHDETGAHVDFRFKAINRMVAGLVGKTPDDIRGGVVSDWFTSYRDTDLFSRYKYTFETGETQRFEINYAVDDFDIWFDVQCARQNDDVLVTFTDFTPLKQAQQAGEYQSSQNRKQAELLNSILDSSDSGIMALEAIRDPEQDNRIVDFRFVIANQACSTILGQPVKGMIGQTLLQVFPGNVQSGLFDAYVHTTETGEPYRTETYYNYDGLDFWLVISTQKLGDGFVVTFADISAIIRATRAAKQSAEQLQIIIDTAQTGIFLFTPVRDDAGTVVDFRFLTANRQLAGYVGQEPQAVVGELGSRWFPDYKQNGLFERYRQTYETGETLRFDFHYDGSGIDVWLDIMSTKTGDAVLVTFGDYTPLKQLQQQLENSVAELQRSNESLQQFAYVASHDLQEPLRKIQSFGDILKNSYGESLGTGVEMLTRMQAAASRMSSLIKDLLAYSRLSTHRDPMLPVALDEVVHRVLDDLDLTIKEAGALVEIENLPIVIGDSLQLQQLLQNLLSNALKFKRTGVKPHLRITAKVVAYDDLPANLKPLYRAASYQVIGVEDNGVGFEEKYSERIFQVFQRLHGKQQYAGTGIGLAIVQKVVDNHGGAVTAYSQPNKGATFTVYLPA